MLGSQRNDELFLLPEEEVRQDLLYKMVHTLNYPKELLAIEVELSSLPHLCGMKDKLPKRRADIICFGKGISSSSEIYPLLIVECKATKLTSAAFDQVKGYNFYVNSYFLAIANSVKIRTFWHNDKEKKYESVDFLPSYKQLIKAVCER